MIAAYRGTLEPLLQTVSRRWSPVNGYVEEAEYRGLGNDQFLQLSQYMAANGFEYEWNTHHAVHSLHAVDTSGAITIDSWEIALNKLSPSNYQNPVVIAALIADGSSYVGALQILKDIAAVMSGKTVTVGSTTITDAEQLDEIYTTLNLNAARRFLENIQLGVDAYYASGYVLRHITNVSNRYSRNIADVGVDRIYNLAQILSETSNSNFWVFPLPGRLRYKITAVHNDLVSTYDAFSSDAYRMWGWLKSGSSEITAANNRVNIVTEYEMGNWHTEVYYPY